MKKTVLRSYAKLIAACGVNIQKGQEVFIQAELDQPEFVTMLVEECYKLKAKKVVVDWNHQPIEKLHVRYRTLTTMSTLDNYEEARWQHYVDTIPCRIYLMSEDPDGLKGVNQEKMAKAQQKKYPIIKGYRDQIENKCRRAGRKMGEEALPRPPREPGHRKALGSDPCDLPCHGRPDRRVAGTQQRPARPVRVPQFSSHQRASL